MRLISAASILFGLALAFLISSSSGSPANAQAPLDGQTIFRHETFGDEQLWTDVLRMHEVIPTMVSPATALAVGLKVDADALPPAVKNALAADLLNLNDPALTVELLRLNAVVGVRGSVAGNTLTSVGITCALCHSTVDNSFDAGIGKRLDGWANTDLDVGQILALSPALSDELKEEFLQWGPGKYDPRHHAYNGIEIVPLNSPSLPIVIPPIYGLKGVGFETFTADGSISYWNAYVGIGQMGGQGTFSDGRPPVNLHIFQTPDLVTPLLPALLKYQLSLRVPDPPKGSFSPAAAARGRQVFRQEGRCATCHQQPNLTDVMNGPSPDVPLVHDPSAVGQDAGYANRSATGKYRTTPLRALWQHPPYFHDGSATTLLAVVNHYDQLFGLHLTDGQKADLVEYLKSL